MKHILFCTSTAMVFSASAALAAPINAESQLNVFHRWLVNGGNIPTGIEVVTVPNSLVIESEATTDIDDPTATETVLNNFVVGNPFADPVIPVQSNQQSRTTVTGSTDSAMAIVDYSIELEDDPADDVFELVRRDIDQTGFARIGLSDSAVASSAVSSHDGARDYRFDNVSDQTISFDLTGMFSADLSADFTGDDGFALSSASFDILFDVRTGASVTYSPAALYLTTIMDSDPGTSVSEQYLANSGGITGVSFEARVEANGTGGATQASYLGFSAYVFGITLDPNASLVMETSFSQLNSIVVEPAADVPPVPLPAGLPLLLSGLAGLGLLRRKSSKG
ncbi:MAG: VPLPA-CTERM sorting domain-containing protein [Paracoccaceae bacterium]